MQKPDFPSEHDTKSLDSEHTRLRDAVGALAKKTAETLNPFYTNLDLTNLEHIIEDRLCGNKCEPQRITNALQAIDDAGNNPIAVNIDPASGDDDGEIEVAGTRIDIIDILRQERRLKEQRRKAV